jgi:hypothetical protein
MKTRNWLILMFLTLSGSVIAEEGCPDGYIPVFQGGTQNRTCVVDYNLPYWQEQNQQPTQPVERWEDRWGAIAIDEKNGVAGAVTDSKTKRSAQKEAIAECMKRGGNGCKVSIAYVNQCAVIIAGDHASNSVHAATVEEASRIGMEACRARNESSCRVYYSG